MNGKKLTVAIVGGAAALSLVGIGAGASFTDAASASQHVSTGTINLLLSTDGSNFGKSVAFAPDNNLTSAGETVTKPLIIANTGSLPVHITNVNLAESGIPIGVGGVLNGNPITISPGDTAVPAGVLTIPAGGSVSEQITFTVGAQTQQGAVGDAVITISGTD